MNADLDSTLFALDRLMPALNSRHPVARAVATKALEQVAAGVVSLEEVAKAAKQIAAETRTPPPPARVPATPEAIAKHQAKQAGANHQLWMGVDLNGTKDEVGPRVWKMVHERALITPTDDTAFLIELWAHLPCGECKTNFLRHLRENPPRWGTQYFTWTVEIHNAVRREQGKPEISTDAARALYINQQSAISDQQ